MATPSPLNFCSTCHSEVSPPSLCCDRCNHKVHNKQTCSGLAPRFASQLTNYSGDSLQFRFLCPSCKSLPAVTEDIELKRTIQNLSKTVQDLTSMISGLVEWKSFLGTDLKESVTDLLRWRNDFEPTPTNTPSQGEIHSIIREELIEMRERDKRRDSVVVRGLDYESDLDFQRRFDSLSLVLVNKKIQLTEITQLNPRFVRAKITNREDRSHLLSATNKLRNIAQFSSVYISRDLTFKQREELKSRRLASRQFPPGSVATGSNSIPVFRGSVNTGLPSTDLPYTPPVSTPTTSRSDPVTQVHSFTSNLSLSLAPSPLPSVPVPSHQLLPMSSDLADSSNPSPHCSPPVAGPVPSPRSNPPQQSAQGSLSPASPQLLNAPVSASASPRVRGSVASLTNTVSPNSC